MNKPLIDIHNHVIPEFDDGPETMEESIEMLRQAEEQGITDVFATSHFNEFIPPVLEENYFKKLQNLREEALVQGIHVNIYSGSELFYHHYAVKTVKSSKVTTLGGFGQYVLIEFPMFQIPNGVEEVLFELSVENYIPIVAHPERYSGLVSEPSKALSFIQYGGLLQLNAGSILGQFGKDIQKLALSFLQQRIVHFVASDAHTTKGRRFLLRKVQEFLKDEIPEKYLNELLFYNPKCIIDEIRIEKIPFPGKAESSGFFGKLKRRLIKS